MSRREAGGSVKNARDSDTKTEDDQTSTDEENDEESSSSDSGDSTDDRTLEGRIREVVKEVVDGLLGDRTKAAGKSTPAQDEASVFRMVQDAQAKLKKEEEKDSRFKEVAETVDTLKKQAEKAPTRAGVGGKIQQWVWGSDG